METVAYRDGVIGMHAPRLANTPGQPLETGCASYAQGLAPPASCFQYADYIANHLDINITDTVLQDFCGMTVGRYCFSGDLSYFGYRST